MKARIDNLDSQSSSSTVLTKHVDTKLNQQFSKGNINLGKSPKLVPCDNQITQVVLTGPSPIWGSSTKEIKTSSDSAWGTMFQNHDTNSVKSSASHPSGSTSNRKAPHEMNSLKPSAHLPWGSISNVTTPIFPKAVTIEEGKKSSATNTITPCQRDNKLSPKNLKKVVDDNKNESLKE